MTIETSEVTLPAHWASYLINGDASGLDDGEGETIDSYLVEALAGGWRVACDVEDSERFTWSYDLYQPDSSLRGGNVLDYVIHRSKES